jgi:hypothetical protein
MINELKLIVDYAYDNIPIYRKIYQQKPKIESIADFQKLPYIRLSDFFNCKIDDVISDVVDVVSILPPIENKSIFPFPRLESAHDRDMRYEIFYFLLEQMNIAENSSFVVLTDTEHSYFCGEIVSNLLFYKHPTSMIMIRDHSESEITDWINRIQPDYLIIGTKRIFAEISEWKVYSIIDINSPFQRENFVLQNIEYKNIYAINEIGWIGISNNKGGYIYPNDYFYVESDPADNILTITTLTSDMLPFIRYKTTDKCIITGKNSFQITYIGEH